MTAKTSRFIDLTTSETLSPRLGSLPSTIVLDSSGSSKPSSFTPSSFFNISPTLSPTFSRPPKKQRSQYAKTTGAGGAAQGGHIAGGGEEREFSGQDSLSTINERLDQFLGELYQIGSPNQFPVQIIPGKPKVNFYSVVEYLPKIQRAKGSLYNGISHYEHVQSMLENMTRSIYRPYFLPLLYSTTFSPSDAFIHNVPVAAIEPGKSFGNITIGAMLGSGVYGSVYDGVIFPTARSKKNVNNSQLKTRQINTALKKAAVVPASTWDQLLAATRVNQLSRLDEPDVLARIKHLIKVYDLDELDTFEAIVEQYDDPRVTSVYADKLLDNITEYVKDLLNDKHQSAYVEAFGYFLGSILTETFVVPFFPLFYGSHLVLDELPLTDEQKLEMHTEGLVPSQLTLIEKLEGSLGDLLLSGFFASRPLDYLWAALAQISMGLSTAQELLGMVHNDFHRNNVLYKRNAPGTYFYYECRPSSVFGGAAGQAKEFFYFKVPAEYQYCAIDFGFATFRLAEPLVDTNISGLSSSAPLGVDKNFDIYNANNDLVKLMIDIYSSAPYVASLSSEIADLMTHILTDTNGVTYGQKVKVECVNGTNPAYNGTSTSFKNWLTNRYCARASTGRPDDAARLDTCGCKIFHKYYEPFNKRLAARYKNGTPSALLISAFYNKFGIAKEDVPKDATVYLTFYKS